MLRGVATDPGRLTVLVILGIRDENQFPLIFYRENCADMALCEDDIDEALIPETQRHQHPGGRGGPDDATALHTLYTGTVHDSLSGQE